MSIKLLKGCVMDQIRTLADESVQCVVSSPPYWGLRDYKIPSSIWGGDPACAHEWGDEIAVSRMGNPNGGLGDTGTGEAATRLPGLAERAQRSNSGGQFCACGAWLGTLGLEPDYRLYIAHMVEVFRQVKRVLRKDGTLWLNMGDSYNAHPGQRKTTDKIGDKQETNFGSNTVGSRSVDSLKPKDLCGIPWRLALALQEPYYDWQIKTEAMRAWVGGIVDGEGCITILQTKSAHSESLSYPPAVQVRMCDLEPLERLVRVVGSSYGKPQYPPSHAAANQRPSWQWKIVSEQAANVIAEIYPFLTCKRKQAVVAWNHQAFRSARGNGPRQRGEIEKEQFCKTLINQLNQRQQVDIPSWMKEPTVAYEPGWYLRQDLIWAKPNPMPESVTDRCTKSHEYLFLLAKSERYHYDAEAIAEDAVKTGTIGHLTPGKGSYQNVQHTPGAEGRASGNKSHKGVTEYEASSSEEHRTKAGLLAIADTAYAKRNKRSVWTITTQPFSEAHFATFPPDLVIPCILAGCPRGGLVLDPFGGAGTTGLVADRLGRNAILIEINPDYAAMASKRITDDAPLFADVG